MERESLSQSRVDDAVAQWETLIAQGEELSPSQFCERCPASIREEVAQRIHALQSIDALLGEVETESRLFDEVATGGDGPSQPKKPPSTLGRYQLLEMVGQGGFGQVWRSRDTELERDVAIKIPRPERLGSPEQAKTFLEEARKAAKLDHPGIVPVFYCDQQDSYFFIVSKWIDGPSLAKKIATNRLTPTESARIIADVADALHHAHLRDLVHRDIKPGNILLDAQGRAYLTDFGIAVTEDELLKESGSISGTLAYMAPEQAEGKSLHVTSRTDIYSLGVVLYELLTGRQPFRGKNLAELREQVLNRTPRAPRTIDETIPVGLERICLKAMAKAPDQRYTTAGDMAKELRSELQEPEPRQPENARETEAKWRKKVRHLLATVAVVLLALSALWALWPKPPSLPPLAGTMQVQVLKVDGTTTDLTSPSALPMQTGDAVRVKVALNRAAYVYLLWIDADGVVMPVYPWKAGKWDERPEHESPIQQFELPADVGDFWPLKGTSGLETVLLLACNEPLPADADLLTLFSEMPRPSIQGEAFAMWLGGEVVDHAGDLADRGPDFAVVVRRHNQVAEMHRWLHARVEPHFALREGVSFVKEGPSNPQKGETR